MAAYAAAWPPLIALLLVWSPPSCDTWLAGPWSGRCRWGREGAGGQGGMGGQKLIAAALHSLPPGRQLCTTLGRLIATATMVASSPSDATAGIATSSRQQAIVARKGLRCSGSAIVGGNPNSALFLAEVLQPQKMPWSFCKDGYLCLLAKRSLQQQ
jgi:hypothetical protein